LFYGLFFAVLFASGCNISHEGKKPATIFGTTMGTSYLVKIARLPPEIPQKQLQAAIDTRLEKINEQMSTYRPMSEISRFNRSSGLDWFEVSTETAQVVHAALFVSAETQGAFDVTVGPLVNLWGFGPDPGDRVVPRRIEIDAARAKIGRQYLKVRMSPPALRKIHADLQVDLSAIAKGFAVDMIAELLEHDGIASYLVEIGGEIRTRGLKKNGRAWTVGIARPDPDRRMVQEVILLHDHALATSGDYRNLFAQNGKRYSHTIDPKTGWPVAHHLASVTVVADRCMQADAWATAFMVLGPEKGYDLAVARNLAVLFLVYGQAGIVQKTTPAFDELFSDS
jgi:thiamine biosynthesis lipoprotein